MSLQQSAEVVRLVDQLLELHEDVGTEWGDCMGHDHSGAWVGPNFTDPGGTVKNSWTKASRLFIEGM